MKTFIDNAGRTWTVAVNVDAIKRVRDLADVNLLLVEVPGEAFQGREDELPIALGEVDRRSDGWLKVSAVKTCPLVDIQDRSWDTAHQMFEAVACDPIQESLRLGVTLIGALSERLDAWNGIGRGGKVCLDLCRSCSFG